MNDYIKPEYLVILLFVIPPALLGGHFAHQRGRSVPLWAALSALFPIFLMIIYFEKPRREVPGGFKRCPACREYIKWKATVCKYCSASQPERP